MVAVGWVGIEAAVRRVEARTRPGASENASAESATTEVFLPRPDVAVPEVEVETEDVVVVVEPVELDLVLAAALGFLDAGA
jgi:hypothetical protein